MDRVGGWMNGGTGGAEWIWVVAGTLVVVLLVIVIARLFNTKA
jgi:hypothetical protein